MKLEHVRLDEKSRLAAAGTAYNQNVFVPCIFRILRAALHRQPLGLRQDHVLLKIRINKRLDVFPCSPAGRSVLHTLPVLFGIHSLYLNNQRKYRRDGCTDHQIKGMKRRHEVPECPRKDLHKGQDLFRSIRAR